MVQKELLSAGVKPETDSKMVFPIVLWVLSLWKLYRRCVRFSSLLKLMGEFPNLSAMTDLYPSIVLGYNFLS